MHRRTLGPLVLVSIVASGCFVPPDAKPSVNLATTFASRFVHRGMTLVDNPVLQPALAVQLPTKDDGAIRVQVEGSMDLRNDTGGAWFPDGHAGRFTQIEALASYSRRLGPVDLRAGVHNYNLPNGLEFPNGERGGTSEVFLLASTEVLEATPYLALHYDFDEVRGAYYRGGLSEDIPLGGDFTLSLDGSLGYVSEAQAQWMYGLPESGLADLRGEMALRYRYDDRTSLRASVNGSLIVDSVQDRWFRDLGIDDDPIWFTIAVTWVF